MILGSDSHTRFTAPWAPWLWARGGGELAQAAAALVNTYDVVYPGVVAIYLTGARVPASA